MTSDPASRKRAILSVSDKRGVDELARGLAERGWEILSTGGTARALREAGVEVTDVADATGHPEMMEGRVKTLHPAIHAGILARRDRDDDLEALATQGYGTFDLVAVNLYPFRETVAAGDVAIGEAMEQVDIGGPTMLRAAAKSHRDVLAVVDPDDYGRVLAALDEAGDQAVLRRELAAGSPSSSPGSRYSATARIPTRRRPSTVRRTARPTAWRRWSSTTARTSRTTTCWTWTGRSSASRPSPTPAGRRASSSSTPRPPGSP